MADAIAHSGPDDEGFHVGEGAVLGNGRLEIIDLSNEDEILWITYNGEICNYRELRHAGHRFRTGMRLPNFDRAAG